MGIVYFIGAGPGDKGLITLKGIEKLKICDVVIYDRLANEEFLRFLKPGCIKIYAGKQAGRHYIQQEEINQILTEYALKDINKPIGVSEYKLLEDIPEYLQSQLPKAEDIELHIQDIEEN